MKLIVPRFTITDAPVSANAPSGKKSMFHPPAAPDSTGCRTSLSDWKRTWNDETIATKFKVTYCGDGETNCGEGCDGQTGVSCTVIGTGDAGKQNCKADCTGYTAFIADPCTSNFQCGGGRCCKAVVGGTNECQDKGTYTPDPKYLCDPGEWFVCDENALGTVQQFDNRVFTCTKQNEQYKWIEKNSISEIKDNGKKADLEKVISEILKFIALALL